MAQQGKPTVQLATPESGQEMEFVRVLMREYADSLQVNLCFQDLEAELRSLPGQYATPRGALRMAMADGAPAGCCAMRPLVSADHANACEMKRLYVRPNFRGLGIGRVLAQEILGAARLTGYSSVLLDTLSNMKTAHAMYRELGFTEIAPYYVNPIPGARYLKVEL